MCFDETTLFFLLYGYINVSNYLTVDESKQTKEGEEQLSPHLANPPSDQSMLTAGLGEVSLQRINLRIGEPCHPSALFKASCRSSSSTCHCTRPRLELAAAAAAALSECWCWCWGATEKQTALPTASRNSRNLLSGKMHSVAPPHSPQLHHITTNGDQHQQC